MAEADPSGSQRLGGIASGLVGDLQQLLRGELALARVELDQKVRTLIAGMVAVLAGAVLGLAGLVVLLVAVAAVLSQWMPIWAAFLLTGLLAVAIGAIMAKTAMTKLSLRSLTPDRTIENVQSDAKMIQEHAR